jgi:hypothetical protein
MGLGAGIGRHAIPVTADEASWHVGLDEITRRSALGVLDGSVLGTWLADRVPTGQPE